MSESTPSSPIISVTHRPNALTITYLWISTTPVPSSPSQSSVTPHSPLTSHHSPTIGTLLALSPEEIIIRPTELSPPALVDGIHVHFPRIGFVVQPFTATARTGDGDRTGLGAVEGKAKL